MRSIMSSLRGTERNIKPPLNKSKMQNKYKVTYVFNDRYSTHYFSSKKKAMKFGRSIMLEALFDGDSGAFSIYRLDGDDETRIFEQIAHKRNGKVTFMAPATSF